MEADVPCGIGEIGRVRLSDYVEEPPIVRLPDEPEQSATSVTVPGVTGAPSKTVKPGSRICRSQVSRSPGSLSTAL